MKNLNPSQVRGFNYHPSTGTSCMEIWNHFDAGTVDVELERAKKFFPGVNAIRLWLSHDSFNRDRNRFCRRFSEALSIADSYGLAVMPVLFNRWHDPLMDFGGQYIDHFLPNSSWLHFVDTMTPYVERVVGEHAGDSRVFAWDICNEPFAYYLPIEAIPEIHKAECDWLKRTYDLCKRAGAEAPVTVGVHPNTRMEDVREICDFISIHPCYGPNSPSESRQDFESRLDTYAALGDEWERPLLATETCWGSLDDGERAEIIRYTLGELARRDIGWMAYVLHHGMFADAHRPEDGPLGKAGYMAFIEADGSLQPGHEAFNEF